jgi:hypothetical protein
VARRIRSNGKSDVLIVKRICDLMACSFVPLSTTLSLAPILKNCSLQVCATQTDFSPLCFDTANGSGFIHFEIFMTSEDATLKLLAADFVKGSCRISCDLVRHVHTTFSAILHLLCQRE